MNEKNTTLTMLLRQLQKVPYLASKNLYVVTQYFLDLPVEQLELFCRALQDAKQNLDQCHMCWAWKEKSSNCAICFNAKRQKDVICVVEAWRDMIALEKAGGYAGVYHILGGALCPLEGIGPDDLTISSLIKRVQAGCTELIFAFNQTPEGEATAAYLTTKLNDRSQLKITCLAQGLPVGSSLAAMDRLTVYKALAERKLF